MERDVLKRSCGRFGSTKAAGRLGNCDEHSRCSAHPTRALGERKGPTAALCKLAQPRCRCRALGVAAVDAFALHSGATGGPERRPASGAEPLRELDVEVKACFRRVVIRHLRLAI